MGFVDSSAVPDSIPDDVDPASIPNPLSTDMANHVAAALLFGAPNVRAMDFLGQPQIVIGPLYQTKTTKVSATDPVCWEGMNFTAHQTYAEDANVVPRDADFAAGRLGANGGPPVSAASPSQDFGS